MFRRCFGERGEGQGGEGTVKRRNGPECTRCFVGRVAAVRLEESSASAEMESSCSALGSVLRIRERSGKVKKPGRGREREMSSAGSWAKGEVMARWGGGGSCRERFARSSPPPLRCASSQPRTWRVWKQSWTVSVEMGSAFGPGEGPARRESAPRRPAQQRPVDAHSYAYLKAGGKLGAVAFGRRREVDEAERRRCQFARDLTAVLLLSHSSEASLKSSSELLQGFLARHSRGGAVCPQEQRCFGQPARRGHRSPRTQLVPTLFWPSNTQSQLLPLRTVQTTTSFDSIPLTSSRHPPPSPSQPDSCSSSSPDSYSYYPSSSRALSHPAIHSSAPSHPSPHVTHLGLPPRAPSLMRRLPHLLLPPPSRRRTPPSPCRRLRSPRIPSPLLHSSKPSPRRRSTEPTSRRSPEPSPSSDRRAARRRPTATLSPEMRDGITSEPSSPCFDRSDSRRARHERDVDIVPDDKAGLLERLVGPSEWGGGEDVGYAEGS